MGRSVDDLSFFFLLEDDCLFSVQTDIILCRQGVSDTSMSICATLFVVVVGLFFVVDWQVDYVLTDTLVSNSEFVNRTVETGAILDYASDTRNKFLLIYGPRGSGKTTLVRHALSNRHGVYWVELFKDSVVTDELRRTFVRHPSPLYSPQLSGMRDFFRAVSASIGVLPIVVLEVHTDQYDGRVTLEAMTAAKALTEDLSATAVTRVIVILSDAVAAFKYTKDPDRRVTMWVGDFSREEAMMYLKNRNVSEKLDRRSLDVVLTEMGMRPKQLKNFCDEFLQSPSPDTVQRVLYVMEDAPALVLKRWILLAEQNEEVRLLLNQILLSPEGFVLLNQTGKKATDENIVNWIQDKGHLLSINLKRNTVEPYSRTHWRLMQRNGIIPPPLPPGLRQDLPPKSMAVEVFAVQLVQLDATATRALNDSQVHAVPFSTHKSLNVSTRFGHQIVIFVFPRPFYFDNLDSLLLTCR